MILTLENVAILALVISLYPSHSGGSVPLGESCLQDDQCRSGLSCSSGICKCPYEKSFSVLTNDCEVNAGAQCKYPYSNERKNCVPNAWCSGGFNSRLYCECAENFAVSKHKSGYCYAKENARCNGDTYGGLTSKQCLPGLVCMDHVCICEYSKQQVFDLESEKCYSSLGGPCSTSVDCRGNETVCHEETLGIGQCQCKKGYIQVGGECQLEYGARCDLETDSGPSCDKLGGLICDNKGVCGCPALQDFNQKELSCKGLVGARCAVNGANQFCRSWSFCKPFRGLDQSFGLCTCLPEYKTGPDRKCTPK